MLSVMQHTHAYLEGILLECPAHFDHFWDVVRVRDFEEHYAMNNTHCGFLTEQLMPRKQVR